MVTAKVCTGKMKALAIAVPEKRNHSMPFRNAGFCLEGPEAEIIKIENKKG